MKAEHSFKIGDRLEFKNSGHYHSNSMVVTIIEPLTVRHEFTKAIGTVPPDQVTAFVDSSVWMRNPTRREVTCDGWCSDLGCDKVTIGAFSGKNLCAQCSERFIEDGRASSWVTE